MQIDSWCSIAYYAPIVIALFLLLTIFVGLSLSYENEKLKKSDYILLTVLVSIVGIYMYLGSIPSTYKYEKWYGVRLRQVGNANMFVKNGRSGNDEAKYQMLTQEGYYVEHRAKNVRVITTSKDYAEIVYYKKIYTSTLGKIRNAQFNPDKDYDYEFKTELHVPSDKLESYVKINF